LSVALTLGGRLTYAQRQTMAMYGDWTLSCVKASGDAGAKSCGLIQVQKFGSQTAAASQIGIGRATSAQPFRFSIEVPSDVWMPSGVKLNDAGNKTVVSAPFKWCVSTRCLADFDLADNDIKILRAQKEPAKILYKTATQADVSIPVSFNGFSDALDALLKQ
jgi:invasion protein IalB